ncbi:hypothetical protein [Calidifontibacillus oryziterrae]|uniref:hypothetical protein n=1 Tax=Calidifontibacillus oryziterrae TaxID=1191699 RepID=UPI0002FFFEFA|nr:hypothetical protein [Calidifontibacillus oryziterrae]
MRQNREEYEVFTRIDRGSDLIHIGTVEAETAELAKVYATHIYNEENWVEMFVVNRKNIIPVRTLEDSGIEEGVVYA